MKHRIIFALLIVAVSFTSCDKSDDALEVDDSKVVTIKTLSNSLTSIKTPAILKDNENITWEVLEKPSSLYRIAQLNSKETLFIACNEGEYLLQATSGGIKDKVKVIVAKRSVATSPYIAKVFDYRPAPGQFVNKLPEYEEGDTHKDMVVKAGESLIGEDTEMISLGGWGGSVTLGFDHTIVNVAGKKDFRIEGNGFTNSSEPGIILVSYDANGNGEPDDEWYEINGSGNFTAEKEEWYQSALEAGNDVNTYRDYEMTYYKPTNEEATTEYIRWTNNKGEEGYRNKTQAHKQSYYPLWISDDEITFEGIRLAENSLKKGGFSELKSFKYGYVDNHHNTDAKSAIDIDWAIDEKGEKANLPGIDFVKIYTGVDQDNGMIGEVSTEVAKGYNLHLLGESIDTIKE